MKREIKFRGLRKDGKGWIYGSLVNNAFVNAETKKDILYIFNPEECEHAYSFEDFEDDYGYYEVIPETVAQFTGAKSKNGQDIYESDINQDQSVVVWNNDDCSFCWIHENGGMDGFDSENEWCEIIGNIHEKGGDNEHTN